MRTKFEVSSFHVAKKMKNLQNLKVDHVMSPFDLLFFAYFVLLTICLHAK